jgi:hypothetical protein
VIQDLIGENRLRFGGKPVTEEAYEAMREKLGPQASKLDVKKALIAEGFEFPDGN